jgi:hypothetical protein
VILPILLAAAPAADPAQLTCAMIGAGEAQVAVFDLDLARRKAPNAVLRFAPTSPYLRTGATSVPTRRADGSSTIAFSTGNGRFRLELMPQGETQRLRLASLEANGERPTLAQGFCGVRAGKRLPDTKPTLLEPDTVEPPRPWKLQALTQRLPDGTCHLVTAAREQRRIDYQVATASGNEWSVRYTATTPDLFGAPTASGSGTQFLLAAPSERIVSTMIFVAGAPGTFVHTTFERRGNFVDIARGGQVIAVGACGLPLPWLAAPSTGTSS